MIGGLFFLTGDDTRFVVGDSWRDARLIKGNRDGYLRDALSQRLQHGVQPRMGDADRGLLEQFQLWRSLDDDGIFRNGSDLLRIKLITYREHQLQISMLGHASNNGAKNIQPAIQYGPH